MNTKIMIVFVSMFLFSGVLPLSLISVDAVTTHHLCPSQSTQEYTASISTSYMDRTLSVFSNETVTLEPTDDTFVRPDYPWQNYGYGDYLWVDSRVTFLKFNLSSVPSYAEVISAELQLCLDENLAGEEIIVESFLYSNNSWTENDLTWDNVDWNATSSSPSDNATLFYGETWTWKNWNVILYIKNALGANVSITLKSNFPGSGGLFSSKDRLSGIYSPRLTLNYSVPIHDGTQVGGIIWENTTWTLEGSPYIITETIQIPENVTLTIAPSVTVTKPTDGDMFLLEGTVFAHGTIDNKIIFDGGGNSDFFTKGFVESAFLDLEYCVIRNGESLGWHVPRLSLKHSELFDLTAPSRVWFPDEDVYIEHNTFINVSGFATGTRNDTKVYIRYNLFKGKNPHSWADFCIESELSYDTSETIVTYNSFLNMEGIVLKLAPIPERVVMYATENYWGTLDTNIIDSMIYDRNDDINCPGFIDYLPILFEPHLDTPKISSTIYVDDNNTAGPWDGTVEHPYQNITKGLDHASKNETIFVYNGTYYENILVNKTVSLVGENKDTTIIDGDRTDNVVHVTSDNNNISGFTVQNSGPYPGSGLLIDHSSGNNISHNIIKNNNYGIWLYFSENSTISSNNILDNNKYGIYVEYSGNNSVAGNTVNANEYGILISYYSNNNVLIGNEFLSNAEAIGVAVSSNNNVIVGNTVSTSEFYGIWLSNSHNNTLSNNIVHNNSIGMWIYGSKHNMFEGNIVSSNENYGIMFLDYSDKNTLAGNNLLNNYYGIHLENSVGNILFHNNFINDTHQVFSTDSQNIWDNGYPSGGNYWSDYTGVDLYNGPFQNWTGCDGIGDTPYVIDENNHDNYPLMKPYPDATPPIITVVSPENKAYTTTSVPLVFTIDECTCWMGYSVDGELNVTSVGNTTLTSLLDGSHHVVVYANDTAGNMGVSNTVYFTVDTTPPNITEVSKTPLSNNVLPEDQIKVNATITDSLSGVKQAILNYTNGNGTWVTKNMTNLQGNVWNGTIPAFGYGTYVNYTIVAEDEVGNIITTEEVLGYQYQYHVIPEFPSFFTLLFMVATLLAVMRARRGVKKV